MEHFAENKRDRKRADWQQHIDKWQRSGLNQQDYCRRNGLVSATFGYWRRKLKANESSQPRFYPLIVSAYAVDAGTACHDHPGLRLVLGDNRFSIEIGDHFSPAVLQRLITTLEQL